MRWLLPAVLLAVTACGSSPATPSHPVDPNTLVTPGEHSGQVAIDFVGATIAPGSTISGCGSLIDGCRDRLRITLRLRPVLDGPVLFARVYLHATNQIACLWGETGAMTLQGGTPATLEVPLDQADRCGLPNDMVSMDAVVEGPTQIESRQVWTIRYHFAP